LVSGEVPEIVLAMDRESEEPAYRQVARQVREMIAYGRLPAGRRLPSVRTLASDLGVNLNTVARAYRALEEEGFVVIRGRSKVEVAAPRERDAREPAPAPAPLLESLREILARLLQSGLKAEEVVGVVVAEVESMPLAGSKTGK
jgi:GntR family transcriptional regulator